MSTRQRILALANRYTDDRGIRENALTPDQLKVLNAGKDQIRLIKTVVGNLNIWDLECNCQMNDYENPGFATVTAIFDCGRVIIASWNIPLVPEVEGRAVTAEQIYASVEAGFFRVTLPPK